MNKNPAIPEPESPSTPSAPHSQQPLIETSTKQKAPIAISVTDLVKRFNGEVIIGEDLLEIEI